MSASASIVDSKLSDFIARLASSDPIPGGGSASAVAGALAAGLVSMVAELSVGRPRYAPFAATVERARADGRRLASELIALADADAAAFAAYLDAARLPRGSEAEQQARARAIEAAARDAAEAPLQILVACREVAQAAERLAGRSNLGLASDLAVASRLAEGAAHGAAENVLINVPSLPDTAEAAALATEVRQVLRSVKRLARATRAQVATHTLREPEARPRLSRRVSSALAVGEPR